VLVRRYQDAIVRLAVRLTGNADDAEDLAQECFLRVWDKLGHYNPSRDFKPWLYQVSTNVILNWLSSRKTRIDTSSTAPIESLIGIAGDGGADVTALKNLEERLVSEVLDALPVGTRVAISLRFLEGFTFQEIAQIQKLPLPTVASRVRRGLAEMRSRLERDGVK
jgi:RNA polymerase sigma-70 factor (ECF subfamily)